MVTKFRIAWVLGLALLVALAGTVVAGGMAAAARTTESDLAVAARTIGMAEAALASAMKGGQSIAQVAQTRGVRPAAVIDAVVTAALAREAARPDWAKMTGAQRARFTEQIRARVSAWVNSPNTAVAGGEGSGAANAKAGPSELDVAARAIGLSTADLAAALRNGQSIALVAQARGVRPAAVIDAVVTASLAKAQANPDWAKMNDARRSQVAAQTRTRVTAWVNGAGAARAGGERPGAPNAPTELDIAARAIGLSTADLAVALRNGQSIAQVAQARGVRPAAVIDAVVTASLAKAQANPDWAKMSAAQRAQVTEQTRARVTAWVNNTGTKNGGESP